MVETPCGGFTMYGFEVVTSEAKNAPLIGCVFRTFTTISSLLNSVSLKMPTRIAPRSLRCRVIALVSTPWIPTTPESINSSSKDFSLRQLLVIDDGLRTTKPATQIFEDSLSALFMPVLPICGAVITTICLWYEGSVKVS